SAASGTSSHCEGNLLVSDKGPGPELDLARHSLALWRQLAPQLADDLGPAVPPVEFEPKGGLVVTITAERAQPLIDFAAQLRVSGVDARGGALAHARGLGPGVQPCLDARGACPDDAQREPPAA